MYKFLLRLLVVAAGLGCVAARANDGEWKPLFDGRSHRGRPHEIARSPVVPAADNQLLKQQVWPQANRIWKDEGPGDFKIINVLHGSFTEKGAAQNLYFYEFGDQGNWSINGLAVLENGKLIAHIAFREQEGASANLLPDLTGDGRNEIAIESWSMHQGYRHGGIHILEVSPKGVKAFGYLGFAEDDLNKYTSEHSQLFVKTGPLPKISGCEIPEDSQSLARKGKTSSY